VTARFRALLSAAALLLAIPAVAQERIDYGPFYVLSDEPDRLYLDGTIDLLTPLALHVALSAHDQVQAVHLNSLGGEGQWAMAVAGIIRSSLLDTVVPEGATCQSACSLLFFAGVGRELRGELGVHRDTFSASLLVPQLVQARDDQLRCLGAAPEVLAAAAVTPARSMYFFSANDVERLGFNRSHEDGMAAMERFAPSEAEIGIPDWHDFQANGKPLAATIETADAEDNVLSTGFGIVTWGLIAGESSTAVGAQFAFGSPGIILRVALTPLNLPGIPYFNLAAAIELLTLPEGFVLPTTARLSFVDPLDGGAVSFQVVLSSGRQYIAAIPTVLSRIALSAIADADELYLLFEGYPESIVIAFRKSEVMTEWLPLMEEHVAATSGRYCTPYNAL